MENDQHEADDGGLRELIAYARAMRERAKRIARNAITDEGKAGAARILERATEIEREAEELRALAEWAPDNPTYQ